MVRWYTCPWKINSYEQMLFSIHSSISMTPIRGYSEGDPRSYQDLSSKRNDCRGPSLGYPHNQALNALLSSSSSSWILLVDLWSASFVIFLSSVYVNPPVPFYWVCLSAPYPLIPFPLSFFFFPSLLPTQLSPEFQAKKNEIYPEVENQASSTVGQQ